MTDLACGCGASLRPDQRYCLRCGSATGEGLLSRARLVGAMAPATAHGPVLPATPHHAGIGGLGDRSLRTATLAFAVVLGSAAWAGARVDGPVAQAQPPAMMASAPAPVSAGATVTPAPPVLADPDRAQEPSETGDAVATASAGPATPVGDLASRAATDTGADADATVPADEPADSETPEADGGAPGGAPEVTASTPPLDRVVVIMTPPLSYATVTDPSGAAPYLATELLPQGALLRSFTAAAPTSLATGVALLSGQAPNPATMAGCPSSSEVLPGTIGEDEQAAGSGCRYPSGIFTTADLLGSTDRTWKAYAEDPAATTCAAPADGTPVPATQPAFVAFRSLTDAPDCGTHVAGTDRLTTDFARAETAPTLSYVTVAGCTPDGTCSPADPAAIDASLRRIVPPILSGAAYDERTAVIVVPAHAPQDAPDADRSTCCGTTRAWAPAPGGGRTGALVLSPLVRPGAVLDEAVDQFDALRTISTALDVRPLGLAGRPEVTGFPRETWERWTPAETETP